MKHGKYPLIITFLVPPLLLYGIFVLSPYLQAFQISTTDWLGYSAGRRLRRAGATSAAAARRLRLERAQEQRDPAGVVPVVTIGLGLFFATMLNMGGRKGRAGVAGVRGTSVYRLVYFFPQVLSVVIIALLWKEVYHPNSGLLNGALRGGRPAHPGLAGRPAHRLLVRAGGDGLEQRRLLRGALRRRHAGHPARHLRGGAAGRGVALDDDAPDHHPAAAGTPCRSPGSTWRSPRWTAFILVQQMTKGGPNFSSDVIGLRMYDTAFGSRDQVRVRLRDRRGDVLPDASRWRSLALRIGRRERIEYS